MHGNIWKQLKKYWLTALLSPLFMLGEAGMDLLQPALMATIVDEGVLGLSTGGVGDISIVISVGVRMILLVLFGAFCGVMSGVFANMCAQNFGNDIRKDAFSHIVDMSFDQTDSFTTGSLVTRITNDVTQVQNMVMMAVRGFIRTLILFLGGIIFMMQLDLSFGVIVLCAMPPIMAIIIIFLGKITPQFTSLQERLDDVNNVMQENVSGVRVVKAYVREEYEKERFGKANGALVGVQLRLLLLMNYMNPLVNIIMNLTVIAVIKVGAMRVAGGTVTPGNVMAAITYITQILNALMRFAMMFQNVSRGMASAKRLEEVIDTESTIRGGGTVPEDRSGTVEFKDAAFFYPDSEGSELILHDINLKINSGETIGILGETGSGKTSLINLIPRFYDVTGGEVLVDGVNVRDFELTELRQRISFAFQRSEIFHETIRENILWGKSDASEDDIKAAADTAQATEFISTRESGFDEVVAQDGHSLSGGQKQRLAIARAVLKKAEILIFDDTTSALDLKTEAKLYEALGSRYPGQTKIIIAQRIASVRNADRIVVLSEGTIAACGSHAELMETSPIYRDIYNSQLGGTESSVSTGTAGVSESEGSTSNNTDDVSAGMPVYVGGTSTYEDSKSAGVTAGTGDEGVGNIPADTDGAKGGDSLGR